MTLSRPVNDFAFIEQETIILERAMGCFARNSCWFMLFELLLPYLRFNWDSLDLCELASKEVHFPCFRVHPCSSVVGISPCPLGRNLNYLNLITVFLVRIV